jgi:galactokinase
MENVKMNTNERKVLSGFKRFFTGKPTVVCSPGRINLIGEHTDYNMGFVLPASVDKAIVLAIQPNDVGKIRLHSTDMHPDFYEVECAASYTKTGIDWADYIIGVVDQLQQKGISIGGFDCAFGGNVPIGAGLSSSAALEGGVVFGLSHLFDLNLSRLEMAQISMRAENEFVGVQCGIMDQFASLHGQTGQVLKLDCRSLEHTYYPFRWENLRVLLCDTKVRRTLAGSEYNIRREQCEQGVRIVQKSYPQVNSLRDVSREMLLEHKEKLDAVVYKRCSYVINENERVAKACEALLADDSAEFGRFMYASHYGLRDNYEVSCVELDVLVEATETLEGVLGARMMGGGFGGCTINLVTLENLDETKAKIRSYYLEKMEIEPEFHVVNISDGTHLITGISDDI